MSNYFVIHATEDGEVYINKYLKEDLEKKLDEHYWGDVVKIFGLIPDLSRESGLLIIKGEIVVPAAVEVVKKVQLP